MAGYRNRQARARAAFIAKGGATPTPTPGLIQFTTPIVAGLGASRVRQAAIGSDTTVYEMPNGILSWLKLLDERVIHTNWLDTNSATMNSKNMDGLTFAYDGDGYSAMYSRIPKLANTRSDIIIHELATAQIQFTNRAIDGRDLGTTFSVAGYCSVAQKVLGDLLAAKPNSLVVVCALVERHTSTNGPWGANQGPRNLVPDVNAAMKTWCENTPRTVFVDIRQGMVDPADNNNPLPWVVRDGTHWTPTSSYIFAQRVKDAIAPYIVGTARGTLGIGSNLVPDLSGDTTITGTNLSGQVATTWKLTRGGATSNSVVAASKATDANGKVWQQFTINRSGMTDGQLETLVFAPASAFSVVSGQFYVGSGLVNVSAGSQVYVPAALVVNGAVGMAGTNNGETPLTSIGGYGGTVLEFPATGFSGRMETATGKATNTTGAFEHRMMFGRGDGSALTIRVADLEYKQVSDPMLLMYNASDTTPIAITSSAAVSFPEETVPTVQITTNKPFAKFAIAGADVAKWSIDKFGLMKRLTTPNFEIPDDANANNVDELTITVADFNRNNGTASQNWTGTTLDIDDGITDLFNGTPGTDLADYSANWTRVDGVANAINIGSGGKTAVNNTAGAATTSRTSYMYVQQGDTPFQEVRVNIASGSAQPSYAIRLQNRDNYLAYAFFGGNVVIDRRLSGTNTTLATFVPYKTLAVNDSIVAQILESGGEHRLSVFQNGVRLKTSGGADYIDVASHFPTVKRAGVISNTGGGSNNEFDNFNNRVAAPIVSSVGLYGLSLTPTTGSAGVNIAATINGKTYGSTIDVTQTSGPSAVNWIADGTVLRGTNPVAGTYVLTLTETMTGAVNSGRPSTITIVVT